MTGASLDYLTIFLNSNFFRFCYKEYFPELLGEARELRKVFFENINVKMVKEDNWYKQVLQQIIDKKKESLPVDDLQMQIEEKLFDLYELSENDRLLILSGSTIY